MSAAPRPVKLTAATVMSAPVLTVSADMALAQAVGLMLDRNISGLPVVDPEARLIGIVTEGDLLRRHEIGTERYGPAWVEAFRVPAVAEAYTHSHGVKVADVMTSPVITVDPEAGLAEIVDLMERRQINRVPVVRNGLLVGVVSRRDVLRALAGALARPAPANTDDESIRTRIWTELSRQAWTLPSSIRFLVEHGRVDLRGAVEDRRYRDALRVAAESTPGVTEVVDHTVLVSAGDLAPRRRDLSRYLPPSDGPGLNLE